MRAPRAGTATTLLLGLTPPLPVGPDWPSLLRSLSRLAAVELARFVLVVALVSLVPEGTHFPAADEGAATSMV